MRKTLKWVALFVVMLPVHLILVLAVTGVPRPPAITAEGVGRAGGVGTGPGRCRQTLGVQGANDPHVPVGESRQIVERVRNNGLNVSYMEGANEGHGFRHPWNSFYAGLAQQEMVGDCLLGG